MESYDRTTIALHWATALLVVLLWGVAQVIDFFPRGTPRVTVRSVHMLLGLVLGVVLVSRIVWRARSGQRLPPANEGLAGHAARLVHYGLYLLLAGTLLLGLFNVWVRGDHFFGLFSVPKFDPNNRELRETVEDLHGWFANTLLIVAGLHAAAALVHHFALRDNVLRRMLPPRARPSRTSL
jgi:cytochrome b561